MNAWTICCGTCLHRWKLPGNGSEFERQAMESRPCPKCGAYTLSCPEPTRAAPKRPMFNRRVRWQAAKVG